MTIAALWEVSPGNGLVPWGTYEIFWVMGYFIAIPLADVVMGNWAVKSQAIKTSIAAAGNPEFLLAVHHDYLAGLIVVILGLVACALKFRYRSKPGFRNKVLD